MNSYQRQRMEVEDGFRHQGRESVSETKAACPGKAYCSHIIRVTAAAKIYELEGCEDQRRVFTLIKMTDISSFPPFWATYMALLPHTASFEAYSLNPGAHTRPRVQQQYLDIHNNRMTGNLFINQLYDLEPRMELAVSL